MAATGAERKAPPDDTGIDNAHKLEAFTRFRPTSRWKPMEPSSGRMNCSSARWDTRWKRSAAATTVYSWERASGPARSIASSGRSCAKACNLRFRSKRRETWHGRRWWRAIRLW